MYKSFSMELAGRTLTVDVGRVGAQANGCAFMHYGDTTVLSTATASEKPRDGIDFFPLSVEYEEKFYSVGKIPGGFNKREGKASENAVLIVFTGSQGTPLRHCASVPQGYRKVFQTKVGWTGDRVVQA